MLHTRRRVARVLRTLLGSNGTSAPAAHVAAPQEEEYVSWVVFAVAGMLERGNLSCFEHAIKNLPGDAPVVEIGSFCGLSTNLLTYFKRKHQKTNPLFTCDRWAFEGAEKETAPCGSEAYREFVKESFLRNARFFSRDDLPHTIEQFSDDFFRLWREGAEVSDVFGRPARLGGAAGFVYIDGNHTYEYAKRDFLNADEFLVPGGFVLFDDSADGSGWEVCRVVKEVEASGRYELVSKSPNYFFRKR